MGTYAGSRARDGAPFTGRYGPLCTIEATPHSPRAIALASNLRPPTRPRRCPGRPAGPALPNRLGVWPGAVGAAGTMAPRAAALPTESCDPDAPGRGPCRLGPEARGQARPGLGDSD